MLETLNTKPTTISRYKQETQVRIAKENHRSCRRINSARVHFSIFRQLYFAIIFIARKPLINRTSSPAKLPFPSAIAHAPLWRYKSLRLSGRCSLCRWSSAPAPEGFLLYGDKRPSDFLRRIPLKPGEERAAVLSGAFSSLGPLLISTVAATPIVFFRRRPESWLIGRDRWTIEREIQFLLIDEFEWHKLYVSKIWKMILFIKIAYISFFFYEIWSRRLFVIGDRIIYNDEQKRFRTSKYLRKIGITPWPLYPKPNPDHIYILYHFGNNQLSWDLLWSRFIKLLLVIPLCNIFVVAITLV